MIGQNIFPAGYDPIVDGIPDDQINHMMEDIRRVYREAADHMPPHSAYINKFCAAKS